jgi:hypothetical protein
MKDEWGEIMRAGIIRSASLLLAVVVLVVQPAIAQDKEPPSEATPSPTAEELQRQIEELQRQLQAVQLQLEQVKKQQEVARREAELEELRRAAAAEAVRDGAPEDVDTGTEFVSGTRMQTMLNPEISINGDIFLIGGDNLRTEMQPRHFELDIQSYLDPYTRMKVVFGYEGAHAVWGFTDEDHHEDEEGHEHEGEDEPGGFTLEEGYLSWVNLPGNTALTVGKKRQQFGVLNRWHMHALPQTDFPWVIQESFGAHGLSGTGVSFEWLMPKLWAHANELVVEVMNGNNEVAFAGSDWKKPTFLAYLKSYWDLNANTYVQVDVTGMHGVTDHDGNLDHNFLALDLVYDWYPLGRELYRGFQLRGMLLRSLLDLEDGGSLNTWGSYVYGQYKFARRWTGGLRWDWVEDQRQAGYEYCGVSPYLSFWQSEFVRLRGQYSLRDHNVFGTDHRYELQFTFAAGPHKHEEY